MNAANPSSKRDVASKMSDRKLFAGSIITQPEKIQKHERDFPAEQNTPSN
jgi:hypothetical protein